MTTVKDLAAELKVSRSVIDNYLHRTTTQIEGTRSGRYVNFDEYNANLIREAIRALQERKANNKTKVVYSSGKVIYGIREVE